jgi:hypothetical protein
VTSVSTVAVSTIALDMAFLASLVPFSVSESPRLFRESVGNASALVWVIERGPGLDQAVGVIKPRQLSAM